MFDLVTGRILSLAAEPFKGVERPAGMRELDVKFGKSAYVVRYRVTDDAVIVTRVWHGRQNRPR
jgi:plasmid stabilization system protein ParE